MVKNHQQRFKWQISILLNLIWHQVGFTKRQEVLNKQKSVYQNYKIIHFYDGIISCEFATHNFLKCHCLNA